MLTYKLNGRIKRFLLKEGCIELKRLYGLKQKEHLTKYPRSKKGHVRKPISSAERIGKDISKLY